MAKPKKLPVYLTEEEVKKLFGVINSPRDALLFRCIYYCGLRVKEACGLKCEDFSLKEKILLIRHQNAKGSKERRVPIPEPLIQSLRHYLALVSPQERLFGLTPQRVWQLIKSYAAKAGLAKNVHPHTLRHSYATHVYTKTGKLELVRELLGHSSMQTAMIYTHLDDKTKRLGISGVFN